MVRASLFLAKKTGKITEKTRRQRRRQRKTRQKKKIEKKTKKKKKKTEKKKNKKMKVEKRTGFLPFCLASCIHSLPLAALTCVLLFELAFCPFALHFAVSTLILPF